MLYKSKISRYKIKKILECFIQDYTATETSNIMKLNRNTINRYFWIFRMIILSLIKDLIKDCENAEYLGYMKGSFGDKSYFQIYKINSKLFISINIKKTPQINKFALNNKEFKKFSNFHINRMKKFHGIPASTYNYLIYDSKARYYYSNEELHKLIWKGLKLYNRHSFNK